MSHRQSSSGSGVVSVTTLRRLAEDLLAALQVPREEIDLVVAAVLEATLAGYDSHGMMRLPRYVQEVLDGRIRPAAPFTLRRETPAAAWVDAGHAFGAVSAARAVALACRKAADVGIGCVSTYNSNDVGRLGSYVAGPAQEGFLVVLTANDSGGFPSVAPHGGAARFFSTNPIAAGIPTRDEPLVIDFSTSMAAVGRLRMAANRGETIPEGWVMDSRGQGVSDPNRYFSEPQETFLLPLGGLLAGHKGFGLQLLVEVLAGGLSSAGMVDGTPVDVEANALFVMALDPDHFVGRQALTAMVEQMVQGLARLPTLPGGDPIGLPGRQAAARRADRERQGIPLDPVTRRALQTAAERLGLPDGYPGITE